MPLILHCLWYLGNRSHIQELRLGHLSVLNEDKINPVRFFFLILFFMLMTEFRVQSLLNIYSNTELHPTL